MNVSLPDTKGIFPVQLLGGVEGSESEIAPTASLIGADRMCLSTDYPQFDSKFPNGAKNLLANVPRVWRAMRCGKISTLAAVDAAPLGNPWRKKRLSMKYPEKPSPQSPLHDLLRKFGH